MLGSGIFAVRRSGPGVLEADSEAEIRAMLAAGVRD